jgi:hypothetical protein
MMIRRDNPPMLVLGNPPRGKYNLLDSADVQGINRFVRALSPSMSAGRVKKIIRKKLSGHAPRAAIKQAAEYAAMAHDRIHRGDEGGEIDRLFSGPARTRNPILSYHGQRGPIDRIAGRTHAARLSPAHDLKVEMWDNKRKMMELEAEEVVISDVKRRRRNPLDRCERAFARGHVTAHQEDVDRFGNPPRPSVDCRTAGGKCWQEFGKKEGWVNIFAGTTPGKMSEDEVTRSASLAKTLSENGVLVDVSEGGVWAYVGRLEEFGAGEEAERGWRQSLNFISQVISVKAAAGQEESLTAKDKKALLKRYKGWAGEMQPEVDPEMERIAREMREQAAREEILRLMSRLVPGRNIGKGDDLYYSVDVMDLDYDDEKTRRKALFIAEALRDAGYGVVAKSIRTIAHRGYKLYVPVAANLDISMPAGDLARIDTEIAQIDELARNAKIAFSNSYQAGQRIRPPQPYSREGREVWGVPLEEGDL